MKWFATAFLSIAAFALPARSQVNSGTIVVIGFSKEKIILAADSRISFATGTHRDDKCKIAAISNKLVFAITGFSGSPIDTAESPWDAIDEARATLPSFTTERVTVKQVAEKWRDRIKPLMERDLRLKFAEVLERRGSSNFFADGIFTGLDTTGEISIVSVVFTFDRTEPGVLRNRIQSVVPTDTMQWVAIGSAEVALEIIGQQTERGRAEHEKLDRELSGTEPANRDTLLARRLMELTFALLSESGRGWWAH